MADYYSLIARAVSRLPSKTDEARHEIYERARTALQERLHTLDPPISAAELRNEQARLEAAISRVETESLFSVMQRFARVEAALSTPNSSFIARVKEFAGLVGGKFNDRDRLRFAQAFDGLTKFFWESTEDVTRLFNSGIRRLLK